MGPGGASAGHDHFRFAYEWFVTGTFRLLTGDDKTRPNDKVFWTKLSAAIGSNGRDNYWTGDRQINIAQLTRHSFAHTGGKAEPELVDPSPPLFIRDGEITICPSDTRALYNLLKAKVTMVIQRGAAQSLTRLWLNDGSCVRLRPAAKDHVWGYDFVKARTSDGRAFRLLTVIDEYTRECLAIDVARRITADDVLERLSGLDREP